MVTLQSELTQAIVNAWLNATNKPREMAAVHRRLREKTAIH